MKYIKILAAAAGMFALAGIALAAPNNAANNPQIVANYPTGDHGVPGEPFLHTGMDVVMQAGNSGIFHQWFYGPSEDNGGRPEGDHTIWKPSDNGQCSSDWLPFTVGPQNFWGDYLTPGTYCVKTNDFHEQH